MTRVEKCNGGCDKPLPSSPRYVCDMGAVCRTCAAPHLRERRARELQFAHYVEAVKRAREAKAFAAIEVRA